MEQDRKDPWKRKPNLKCVRDTAHDKALHDFVHKKRERIYVKMWYCDVLLIHNYRNLPVHICLQSYFMWEGNKRTKSDPFKKKPHTYTHKKNPQPTNNKHKIPPPPKKKNKQQQQQNNKKQKQPTTTTTATICRSHLHRRTWMVTQTGSVERDFYSSPWTLERPYYSQDAEEPTSLFCKDTWNHSAVTE